MKTIIYQFYFFVNSTVEIDDNVGKEFVLPEEEPSNTKDLDNITYVDFSFENNEGKLTTLLNEDLPYDINGKDINLKDEDFPIWYLDITECFDKYFEGGIIVCLII